MDVTGKVIWITGASSGIGEALSYELSKRQAKLILSARREEELIRVKNKCTHPEDVFILPLDLSCKEQMTAKAETAFKAFKGLDILVNNGGISQRSLALETELEVDIKLIEVNLMGTIALTKAVYPYLLKNQESMVVVITSLVGKFGTPLRSAYSASKHGLHGFFDSLRAELAPEHKVLIACPGFITTSISLNALTKDGKKQGAMDEAQAKGMSSHKFAAKLIEAMKANKEEVYIGGKERLGVYLKRFFPGIFSKMIRKTKVT